MPIYSSAPQSQYEPPPAGLHQGVCCDVVDLGLVENKKFGKTQPMVRLYWVLDDLNKEGRPHIISQSYTNSLHEKAKLRQHLEAWRGKPFTAEELVRFDLEKLLGANCQIQVVHNISSEGRTYANVSAVVALGQRMARMEIPKDYVRHKDRQNAQPPTEDPFEPDMGNDPVDNDDCPF